MRRFFKYFLLCILAICIASTGLTVSSTAPAATYAKEFSGKTGYRSLTNDQRRCYGAIYTTLIDNFGVDEMVTYQDGTKHVGVQISLPAVIESFEEVQAIFTAFWRDNPQFFYVDNRYSVQHYTAFGKTVYTHISLLYTMNAADRLIADKTMENVIRDIVDSIPDTKDQYIKELRVHDALLNICTYDEEAAANTAANENKNVYSAYGALVEGRAVCEGYARAMQLLLTRVGIKSSLISGKSVKTGEGHIWNLVTINGSQYHLDATWNDVGSSPQHVYFNCTNAQLQRTHAIDKQFSDVTCGTLKDNFYVRSNLYLQTDDQTAIIDVIEDQLKNRSRCIEMRFSPQSYEGARAFLKDGRLTRELVNIEIYFTEYILWRYVLYSYDECYVLCLQPQ